MSPKLKKEEIAGYVRIDRERRNDCKSRFKATISTPLPDVMRKQLESCLPDQEQRAHSSLPSLIDDFLYIKQIDDPDSAEWLFYETKETDKTQDDNILKAINSVRQKEGKGPLKWTHLAVFIGSKTKTSTNDVERTLEDWINNELMPEQPEGELRTWIAVTPVNMLPDEYTKKGKNIPLPVSLFEKILDEADKSEKGSKK